MAFKVKLAVNISFFANCCLAGLQLYSAISSLSLALFATAVDSGKLSQPYQPSKADLQCVRTSSTVTSSPTH
jgi:hypothetical protein